VLFQNLTNRDRSRFVRFGKECGVALKSMSEKTVGNALHTRQISVDGDR